MSASLRIWAPPWRLSDTDLSEIVRFHSWQEPALEWVADVYSVHGKQTM